MGSSTLCSIDIPVMHQLIKAGVSARDELRGAVSGLRGDYLRYSIGWNPRFAAVEEIAAWVDDHLPDLRRRVAMAEAIAASGGGGLDGQYVQFDESLLSVASPAQARRDARAAADALRAGDLETLRTYLKTGAYDPYFAYAFAQAVTPRELGDFIGDQSAYGDLRADVDPAVFEEVLTGLATTLGQATKGTDDLQLPKSWTDAFLQAMTAPIPQQENDHDDYMRNQRDQDNVNALLLLLERGRWSTDFLKDATSRFWAYDKAMGPGAWNQIMPGDLAVGPDGKVATDGMLSLMKALAKNPQAANWAFTHGGTSDVPLHDSDVGINSFLHYMFTEHRLADDADVDLIAYAVGAGINGDAESQIAKDVQALQDSMAEQKAEWDAKPWYEKWGQTILDALSMIPVIGIPADLASATWSAFKGDWTGVSLSVVGMVPLYGDAAESVKLLRSGAHLAKLVDKFGNTIDLTTDAGRYLLNAEQVSDAVFEFDNVDDFVKAMSHPHPNITYKLDDITVHTDDMGRFVTDPDVPYHSPYDGGPRPPQGTHRGLDDPGLPAWLDEMHAAHPEMSRSDLRALWDYTTDDGYDAMNGALRAGATDPAVLARIRATEAAMDGLPPVKGVTYRGTNLPDSVVKQLESGYYRDPAFSSSSFDPKVADGFIRPGKSNPTKFTIIGHSGVDVKPFSAAAGEAEILFKPGVQFRVLENVVDENGFRHVILKEVPGGR